MLTSFSAALQAGGPVPEADAEEFVAAWETRPVAEGEFLFRAGRICQELFFVQAGVVRIVARSPQGQEITHSFRRDGHLCTLLASFEQQVPTPLSIQAACAARGLAIGKARLDQLCQQLPAVADWFRQLTQQQVREKLQMHRAYLGLDAATRYQTFLAGQPEIAGRVPQRLIASYLGITPQSLSRLRRAVV